MEFWRSLGKLEHFFTALHQIQNKSIIVEIVKNAIKIHFKEKPRMKKCSQDPT